MTRINLAFYFGLIIAILATAVLTVILHNCAGGQNSYWYSGAITYVLILGFLYYHGHGFHLHFSISDKTQRYWNTSLSVACLLLFFWIMTLNFSPRLYEWGCAFLAGVILLIIAEQVFYRGLKKGREKLIKTDPDNQCQIRRAVALTEFIDEKNQKGENLFLGGRRCTVKSPPFYSPGKDIDFD